MREQKSKVERKFFENSPFAAANRQAFTRAATTVVSLVGSAGSGKTSLIEAAARQTHHVSLAAIIGNLASMRDADRLQREGVRAAAYVTDNLTAKDINESLAEFDLDRFDILFIESSGNADSPVEYDFGQHARVAVFSIAGGDDKAAASPRLIAESDVIVLTKTDLLPYVTFDLKAFIADVKTINPEALIISAANEPHGFDAWVAWLSDLWTANPGASNSRKNESKVGQPSHRALDDWGMFYQ